MSVPKQIAEIQLKVYDNGTVDYYGPLNDVLFVTDILNKAERGVLNHFIELRQKAVSNIVKPEIILSNGFKNKMRAH